jgi:PAS domain-containing protein
MATEAHPVRPAFTEQHYRELFNALDQGFCTVEVLFDHAGVATDYRFLDLNPAFEQQTGLHGAAGRLMRDLAPQDEEHWFRIYGDVALTGTPVRFEQEGREAGSDRGEQREGRVPGDARPRAAQPAGADAHGAAVDARARQSVA